jgi:hypothetical protein
MMDPGSLKRKNAPRGIRPKVIPLYRGLGRLGSVNSTVVCV